MFILTTSHLYSCDLEFFQVFIAKKNVQQFLLIINYDHHNYTPSAFFYFKSKISNSVLAAKKTISIRVTIIKYKNK
ncbi:hypothetical protein DERF_001976 [Dermatophagoides farinae]|uniref:Uncharacterized protein n=1 Tax=Dermatophagoides farinae TaxID=6954 RepID=A0A922IET4_DERFA|nr:hypothetical protein DERF_001976 [Dermatophagoides farinae]